jgi:hypothetical protein
MRSKWRAPPRSPFLLQTGWRHPPGVGAKRCAHHEGVVTAVETLRAAYPDVDIVMVTGNHEYYGHVWHEELEAGRERARALGVHLLECENASFGRLRVIGATFWTDYSLFGPGLQQAAMRE